MNIWIPIVLFVVGTLGFLGVLKFAEPLVRKVGSVAGLTAKYTFLALMVVGLILGGATATLDLVKGQTASVIGGGDADVVASAITGGLTVTLDNGVTNYSGTAVTTEDYYNDDEDFITFYSADANIYDGNEYAFNVTIERELIGEDANVKLTCTAPDKEISGVTADSLIEKTAGQIDLDFAIGAIGSSGKHIDDNTVYVWVPFSEGTASVEVEVAFDHEETYHDGMTDLDDYFEVLCDADGVPFTARIYADS